MGFQTFKGSSPGVFHQNQTNGTGVFEVPKTATMWLGSEVSVRIIAIRSLQNYPEENIWAMKNNIKNTLVSFREGKHIFFKLANSRWWQLKYFLFPPLLGEDEPNLTSIFLKWVGSTTNQKKH